VCIVRLRGEILQAAVAHSRAAAIAAASAGGTPGFLQLDDKMEWAAEAEGGGGQLLQVAGEALDPARVYRVVVPYHSLNGMHRNQPLIDWANGRNSGGMPHSSLAQPLKDVVVRAACGGGLMGQSPVNFAPNYTDRSGNLDCREIRDALGKLIGNCACVPDFMASSRFRIISPPSSSPLARGDRTLLPSSRFPTSARMAHLR
jgi:hypothetical protein